MSPSLKVGRPSSFESQSSLRELAKDLPADVMALLKKEIQQFLPEGMDAEQELLNFKGPVPPELSQAFATVKNATRGGATGFDDSSLDSIVASLGFKNLPPGMADRLLLELRSNLPPGMTMTQLVSEHKDEIISGMQEAMKEDGLTPSDYKITAAPQPAAVKQAFVPSLVRVRSPLEPPPAKVVSATASSSCESHGAELAVSGGLESYWASELDPEKVVSLNLKLDEPRRVNRIRIDWEYAPREFEIQACNACITDGTCECPLKADGSKMTGQGDKGQWFTVHRDEHNVLSESVALAKQPRTANLIRINMKAPAGEGHMRHDGHALYGIRNVEVM